MRLFPERKNYMRKFIPILLVTTLLFGLVGCSNKTIVGPTTVATNSETTTEPTLPDPPADRADITFNPNKIPQQYELTIERTDSTNNTVTTWYFVYLYSDKTGVCSYDLTKLVQTYDEEGNLANEQKYVRSSIEKEGTEAYISPEEWQSTLNQTISIFSNWQIFVDESSLEVTDTQFKANSITFVSFEDPMNNIEFQRLYFAYNSDDLQNYLLSVSMPATPIN